MYKRRLFTEFYDNTAHIDNVRKGKSKLPTTQIKTMRNERRKPSNNSLKNNNGRFIKDLSKRNLTHAN